MIRKINKLIDSRQRISRLILLLVAASATMILLSGTFRETQPRSAGKPAGSPRLISYEQLPPSEGEMCEWVPASYNPSAASNQSSPAVATSTQDEVTKRKPLRVIQDPYAGFSAVAVDPIRNEAVLTDENR